MRHNLSTCAACMCKRSTFLHPVHTHRRTCKIELPEGGGTQATPVRGIFQHIMDDSANQHASAQLALEVLPRCTNVPCDHTREERRGLWRCGCAQGGSSISQRGGEGWEGSSLWEGEHEQCQRF